MTTVASAVEPHVYQQREPIPAFLQTRREICPGRAFRSSQARFVFYYSPSHGVTINVRKRYICRERESKLRRLLRQHLEFSAFGNFTTRTERRSTGQFVIRNNLTPRHKKYGTEACCRVGSRSTASHAAELHATRHTSHGTWRLCCAGSSIAALLMLSRARTRVTGTRV